MSESMEDLFATDQAAWREWGLIYAAAIIEVVESGYGAAVEIPAPPPCLVAQALGRAAAESKIRLLMGDDE